MDFNFYKHFLRLSFYLLPLQQKTLVINQQCVNNAQLHCKKRRRVVAFKVISQMHACNCGCIRKVKVVHNL